MKNEEKDKRYVYIRVRDICIIGVIIIVLSLLWNFRDKVETLFLLNDMYIEKEATELKEHIIETFKS